METLVGDFRVHFRYQVNFTTNVFARDNSTLLEALAGPNATGTEPAAAPPRVLFVLEQSVDELHNLRAAIAGFVSAHSGLLSLAAPPLVVPGGEQLKNDRTGLETILRAVHRSGLDRQSFLVALGGGALLDVAGFAAATAHRGVRLVRIPTTTLAQADSGLGIKNAVNGFGQKNFLGAFAPPWAVVNDARFLETLPDRDWRGGIAEAVKVALIRDASFFDWLETQTSAVTARELPVMIQLVRRCAQLHLSHICNGGDPFETGSSRPLDFGHWAAHKLEQLTEYALRHGEAVAIGVALDAAYSELRGWLAPPASRRVAAVLRTSGFVLFHPALESPELFAGLTEFRRHLGGRLTVQMLRRIGEGFNVHEVDEATMRRAIDELKAAA